MATIKIHLLESRATATTYNDVSIESPNNYRIIEGEKNTTQFELVYDQNVWNGYTFSVEMVNSKGYSVVPPAIENNTFYLPDGMATAGYGYIGIKAEKESKVVTFMPVKVKVWDYVEAWKGNVIDRNITFQEFVDLENRVEDLEQNGTGGGSVANAVTTDTAQTITGEKTFTKPVKVSDCNYYRDGHSELYPDGILTTDEEGNKTFLEYPFQDGTLATQEFVENYVAENGGGSSADVGEIQVCCYYGEEYDASNGYGPGVITTISQQFSGWVGRPVVGQYLVFKNGFGKVIGFTSGGVQVEIVKLDSINFNGSNRRPSVPIYAPATPGNSGDFLISTGHQPEWKSLDKLTSFAANQCMVTYEAPEEMAMIMYTLYGNYTGGYVYTLRDAYNLIVNAVGENVIVFASGIWMDTTTGNQLNVLAVAAMDGMFVAITSDTQQHIIDLVGEGEDYFAQLDFVQMPMGKTFDDSDNLTEGGEGEA